MNIGGALRLFGCFYTETGDKACGKGRGVCRAIGIAVGHFTADNAVVQQIHGRVQHAGRKPIDDEGAQRRRDLYDRLTRQLEQAVSVEDFETAAILRDQIRQLNRAEGGDNHAS